MSGGGAFIIEGIIAFFVLLVLIAKLGPTIYSELTGYTFMGLPMRGGCDWHDVSSGGYYYGLCRESNFG